MLLRMPRANRAANCGPVNHAGKGKIINIACLAGDLGHPFFSGDRLSGKTSGCFHFCCGPSLRKQRSLRRPEMLSSTFLDLS